MSDERPARWIRPALIGLLVLHAALTAHWLLVDRSMGYLAIQDHYARAVDIRRVMALPEPPPLLLAVSKASGYRPALPFVLALPAMSLGGESVQAAAMWNPLWMVLLLWAVYRLGTRWSDATGGLLAAATLGACPIVLGHRGLFLPFLPQAALVAAAAVALVEDAERPGWRPRVVGGLLVGLGLLCRWETAAFATGIGLGLIAAGVGERLARLGRLVGAAAVSAVVAGPWYVYNFQQTIELYVGEGILSTSHAHEQNLELFSLANLLYYPRAMVQFAMGAPLALLAALALVAVLVRRHPGRGPLVGWICLPWLALLVIPMKSARYVIAMLPALCLALAIASRHLARRDAVAGGLAGLAMLQLACLLWLPGAWWEGLRATPASRGHVFTAWEDALDYGAIRPYRSDDWQGPIEQVFAAVEGSPSVLLLEEPINVYTIPIKATSRAVVQTSLGLFEHPAFGRMMGHFTHVVIAGPLAADMRGYFRTHRHQQRYLAPILRDLERRQVVVRATLPDGMPVIVYGRRGY